MTYNLEQHNAQTGRHERDVVMNQSYQVCRGIKMRLEAAPKMPGTFWKIVPNHRNKIAYENNRAASAKGSC